MPKRQISVASVFLFCSIALGGFWADVLTKSIVFERFFHAGVQPTPQWWIPGILGIETTTNPGALFGLLPGFHLLFAGLSVVALLGIIAWIFLFAGHRDRWLTCTLGMISGGILGNLYDRLGFGYIAEYPESIRYNVRDWIYFRLEGVPGLDPWPNFNLADSLLVCGAVLLVLHSLFAGSGQPTNALNESAPDSSPT